MKTHLIALACTVLFAQLTLAQNSIDSILAGIERSNTALAAARQQAEAQASASNTGIYLPNPEVELAYLVGDPSGMGNRKDVSITQSFDFPTAYRYRRQIARFKGSQSEQAYLQVRRDILRQAMLVCADIVYYNAFTAELLRRAEEAKALADAVGLQVDKGDAGIMDLHKAQRYYLACAKDAEMAEIERAELVSVLQSLNGGQAVALADTALVLKPIADFELWSAEAEQTDPHLQYIRQETAISEKQESLSRAQSLPKFSAGYMGEYSDGTKFQGISVGMTIPLWENKNAVRAAKANSLATKAAEEDARSQYYSRLQSLYAKASRMQAATDEYRAQLSAADDAALLGKALSLGQISLGEYLIERASLNQSRISLLDMQRSLNQILAELYIYQL